MGWRGLCRPDLLPLEQRWQAQAAAAEQAGHFGDDAERVLLGAHHQGGAAEIDPLQYLALLAAAHQIARLLKGRDWTCRRCVRAAEIECLDLREKNWITLERSLVICGGRIGQCGTDIVRAEFLEAVEATMPKVD